MVTPTTKKISLFIPALFAFVSLLAQVNAGGGDAGLTHAGHFIFRIPEGWKASLQGNLFSMTASDTGPDQLLTFLLLEPATDNDFKTVADATITQIANALHGETIEQPFGNHPLYFEAYTGRCLHGWDYSLGSGNIRIHYRTANDPYAHMDFTVGLYFAKVNGRIERACYLSRDYKCGIFQTSTSAQWTYDRIIDEFFFNLRFDDWAKEYPRSGKITNAGITGVWGGVAYFEEAYRAVRFILFDNGQVYYNSTWPKTGFANLNTIADAGIDPPHWGTYTFQGGSGVMKFPLRNVPFSISGDKLTATMIDQRWEFKRMPALDDIRLNGVWSAQNGAISIAFTADGKFADHRVIRTLEHKATTCDEVLPEKGEGTYEISNHSIFFHYSNGLTAQMAFSAIGLQKGDTTPEQLIMGWKNDVLTKH